MVYANDIEGECQFRLGSGQAECHQFKFGVINANDAGSPNKLLSLPGYALQDVSGKHTRRQAFQTEPQKHHRWRFCSWRYHKDVRCARFRQAPQVRWWLVLGREKTDAGYVIALLITFGGKGIRFPYKDEWKRDYYREIHNCNKRDQNYTRNSSSVNTSFDEGLDLSNDEDFSLAKTALDEGISMSYDEDLGMSLNPGVSLYSEGYPCRPGSVVSLTIAFVVESQIPTDAFPHSLVGPLRTRAFKTFGGASSICWNATERLDIHLKPT